MGEVEHWKQRVNWKAIALFPLVPTVVALAVLPQILHALDFGSATTTVARLSAGESPSSTNLVVTGGRALYASAYQLTTTRDGSVERIEQYVPLVPLDWQPGQKVPVVLHLDRGIAADANVDRSVVGAESFAGIARSYAWEGVSENQRDVFRENLHLDIAENALLLDLDPSKYLDYLFAGAPIMATLVMLFIARMMIQMERDAWTNDLAFEKKFEESRRAHAARRGAGSDDDDDDDDDDEN